MQRLLWDRVRGLFTALVRAPAVAMHCRCVFRQEEICTVLVSKIVFLQELGPRAGCMWTEVYLDVVGVPLGSVYLWVTRCT